MKTWGQYGLVSSPAEADLVFQVSFTDSLIGLGGSAMPTCSSTTNPQQMVVLVDPKANIPLWWFAEGINVKEKIFRTQEKLGDAFEDAMGKLVEEVKKLGGGSGAKGLSC